jgi:hypothetical protein
MAIGNQCGISNHGGSESGINNGISEMKMSAKWREISKYRENIEDQRNWQLSASALILMRRRKR